MCNLHLCFVQQVFLRIATHAIGTVLHFIDDNVQDIVVLEKFTESTKSATYYLYQAQSEVDFYHSIFIAVAL